MTASPAGTSPPHRSEREPTPAHVPEIVSQNVPEAFPEPRREHPPPPYRPAPQRPAQHAPPDTRWQRLRADLRASVVVFLVAVPLSLGIALASGAPIMAGLVAAVVGAVVAGLLGGSPLQVTGPAAGLTVVVAELVARYGWQVTCLVTIGAGLLQIALGMLRVARFVHAIPPAVVHGMLAGIGLSIALAQVHVVLGGTPPAGPVDAVLTLPAQAGAAVPGALAVGALTALLLVLWPRLPRVRAVPAALVAVAAGTALALLWPQVPRVDLPASLLDAITLPSLLPAAWAGVPWFPVVGAMLTVALIASVESLLSAVAVDRLHDGELCLPTPPAPQAPPAAVPQSVRTPQAAVPRCDPDRELVGQGAANAVSGFLGGLPVTGVIVRSSANVRAGARTRAATVLHGVWVVVFAVALVGAVELVPLAALAALLVVIGLGLVKPADMRASRTHRELVTYLGTVAGVLALTLLEGVLIGLALAGLRTLHRAVRARVRIEEPAGDLVRRVVVEGALSFLSVPALSRTLGAVPPGEPVRVDLVVDYLDHAAYDHLHGWVRRRRATGAWVEVSEPAPGTGRQGPPLPWYATWSRWQETDDGSGEARPYGPILAGVAAYHADAAELLRPTLLAMAERQCPYGLLLTCSDSRVQPSLITRSGPGDLFTVQNVGNLVAGTAVGAAMQYATAVLDVPLIAVCGHSACGAMRGLIEGADADRPGEGGALAEWLRRGAPSLAAYRAGHPVGRAALAAGFGEAEALAMVNVAVQLGELRSRHGDRALLGLYFDIPTARVLVLDEAAQEFRQTQP